IEIPEEEKLRQLAISTEHDIFAEGWTGLRAIYEAAAKANSQDLYVFCSWGISAHSWYVDYRTPELTKRLAIASEAEKVLTIALKLEPQDSHIAYILGLIYYDHPARDEDLKTYLSKAISWFRRALEWDEFRSHDAVVNLNRTRQHWYMRWYSTGSGSDRAPTETHSPKGARSLPLPVLYQSRVV